MWLANTAIRGMMPCCVIGKISTRFSFLFAKQSAMLVERLCVARFPPNVTTANGKMIPHRSLDTKKNAKWPFWWSYPKVQMSYLSIRSLCTHSPHCFSYLHVRLHLFPGQRVWQALIEVVQALLQDARSNILLLSVLVNHFQQDLEGNRVTSKSQSEPEQQIKHKT